MTAKTRRQQLEEMIAEDPTDAMTRYFLAMDHVSAGDDDGAVRVFRELVAAAPDYPPAYLQGGQALLRLNRRQEARDLLTQGVAAARRQHDLHAAEEMQGLLGSL